MIPGRAFELIPMSAFTHALSHLGPASCSQGQPTPRRVLLSGLLRLSSVSRETCGGVLVPHTQPSRAGDGVFPA